MNELPENANDAMLDSWIVEHREEIKVADDPVLSSKLHGRGVNKQAKVFEKPWQRAAAHMFGQACMSNAEVAAACGVNIQTVRVLLATPWFQEHVTALMADKGKDVMDFFRAEGMSSALTLIELRDNVKASPAVRKAAADSILDRAYGKAVQRVETNSVLTSSDPVAEERRLREENERLRV